MDLIGIFTNDIAVRDNEWFTKKFRECEPNLYRLAFSILKNVADSQDALSEAALKAYQYRNKLKKEEMFKAWMSKILIREAYKIIKKRNNVHTIPLEECGEIVEEDGLKGELIECIKTLPADLAEALVLYYYEDYTVKEIAYIVGVREGTIKSRLFRGRQILKKYLKSDEEA